jgi:nitroimidazol reductase NimA-like FMN-containing flavoprotein (pyridoxamine 5'-phosphate oxidase superfamily)
VQTTCVGLPLIEIRRIRAVIPMSGQHGKTPDCGYDLVVDIRQIEQELATAGAQGLLTNSSMARLAYNGLDGRPRVIPIGFFWTGTEIVLSTAASSPKVAALSARPDVALSIDSGDRPDTAKALSVRGTARMKIVNGVTDEYIAGAKKFLDAEEAAKVEQQVWSMYDRMARIAIQPRWVRFYDFGAGRLPKFLSDLAERT